MNCFKSSRKAGRSVMGFTLIELLVVISIIAVLAGGVGIALRSGSPDSGIRSAQGVISGVLASVRGQAALKQTYAKIIVQSKNSEDGFLQLIRVVTGPDPVNGPWTQAGGDILLPSGVYVVPNASITGTQLAGSGRLSTFFVSNGSVPGITDMSSATWLSSAVFSPVGTVAAQGNIVVGSARVTGPGAITFDNYDSVRGVAVSRYGVANLVNDAASFGN